MEVAPGSGPIGAMRRLSGLTPRSRSMRLYGAVAIGIALLATYSMLRVGMCWGNLGIFGTAFCKLHYLVGAMGIAGLGILAVQILEIGRPHRQAYATQRFVAARAALHGYRDLEGSEARHVSVSTGLISVFVIGCIALMIFTPVLF